MELIHLTLSGRDSLPVADGSLVLHNPQTTELVLGTPQVEAGNELCGFIHKGSSMARYFVGQVNLVVKNSRIAAGNL